MGCPLKGTQLLQTKLGFQKLRLVPDVANPPLPGASLQEYTQEGVSNAGWGSFSAFDVSLPNWLGIVELTLAHVEIKHITH